VVDENEREWRRFLLEEIRLMRMEIKQLNEGMTTLKIKAALLVSLIGGVAGFLGESVRKKLGL
jgi:hypothetical protein